MSEQITNELKKLTDIAADPELAPEIRTKAMKQIGRIGTYDALVALLGFVANEQMPLKERDLALKYARGVLKTSS